MKKILSFNFIVIVFCLLSTPTRAFDVIYKTNGDSIQAKILEIGTNAVLFENCIDKSGSTYLENKSDINFIRFENGTVREFEKTQSVQKNTGTTLIQGVQTLVANKGIIGPGFRDGDKNKIEKVEGKYYINGQKASIKEVNSLLNRSSNPAISIPLRSAKLMKGAQRIVKITSIPSSIGGGFTTLWKVVDMYNDIQRGRADANSYVNAALSMVGTITLPIANKILKNKSNNMYDQLISTYNQTN